MSVLEAQFRTVAALEPIEVTGRVSALRGLTVHVRDLPLPVGSLVAFPAVGVMGAAWARDADEAATAGDGTRHGEIVGFSGAETIVMMLGATTGIRPGDRVVALHAAQTVGVGRALLGRCIDGLGRPIDGLGAIHDTEPREVDPRPIGAMRRERITEVMQTGIRAIDLMTTIGRGQRMGIFAGPGVGKSTLLASAARHAGCDVCVVALIGERGREVKDFIRHALGKEGLARSVVVAATSDESPLMRVRAAQVACAAAEHFRDAGLHVLLLMDSITRFAHAQRQIGLSIGEPPATKGYTPSVFAGLARLLERAGAVAGAGGADGAARSGSITGLYTILVEGDEATEPISDAARGILDGHIMLSRALAQKGHFPAIDVLDSVSRVADGVIDAAHRSARRQIARLLANYREIEDLLQIGAYAKGSQPETDLAVAYYPRIVELLRQEPGEYEALEQSRARLVKLAMESTQAGGVGGAGGAAGAKRAG
ncbi:MAG: FliI/YscN family ATPase [Phycisphaerales bacterium]